MPSSAAVLSAALDPGVPYVVLENHYATPASWTRAAVPLDFDTSESASVRLVRAVQFDLALTFDEFMSLAASKSSGGFLLWQTRRWPPPSVSLIHKSGAALKGAFSGVAAGVKVDWPGQGDFALVSSDDREVLAAGLERFLEHESPQ